MQNAPAYGWTRRVENLVFALFGNFVGRISLALIADLMNSTLLLSPKRTMNVFSLTFAIVPIMPPIVRMRSPVLSSESILACAFWRLRWGAIIKKYIAANMRTTKMSMDEPPPCCAFSAGAAACAKRI